MYVQQNETINFIKKKKINKNIKKIIDIIYNYYLIKKKKQIAFDSLYCPDKTSVRLLACIFVKI